MNENPNAAVRQSFRESLYATAHNLCGMSDINSRTHKRTLKTLESPSKRKLIVLPRDCFKTSLGSVAYPIWLLINNPNLRIMLDSSLYSNSEMRVREIKAHMQTERFVKYFGDWKGELWSQGEIIVKPRTKILKEPSVFASGIGASKTGVHADVIIADDINEEKNSMTSDGLEKVYRHYALYGSILDPNGTLVVIGTRWASGDVIGRILQNEIMWGAYDAEYIKNIPRE